MADEDFKRKLTAVFSADAVGYSRLMGEDEAATVKTLESYKQVMFSLIKQHRGRVIDSPGDNLLAEFASVVDAVQCAVAIQNELKARNEELPENRKMQFRIGVNLGDVIEEGDRIYGDGVNIAARLESLADPGGICVSKTAFDYIETKLPLGYEFLGEQEVKNIAKPVGAYRVLMEPRVTVAGEIEEKKAVPVWRRRTILGGAAALVAVVIAALIWNFYFRPPPIIPASVEKMAYPLPDKPSIAVLPFDNLTGDPQQEYFSDGLTEEIITALSKVPYLLVIARNSTFSYKGKPEKISRVAEELGVRYVLEGSFRKTGERVRVTAQLIDAVKGHHLWAERYERELGDIFALEDEITLKILWALEVKLTEGEQAITRRKVTDNLEAYLKTLEAIKYISRLDKEGNLLARQMAEEAIALDPEYARPYRALAITYVNDIIYGTTKSPKSSIKRAYESAQKAISLDDSDPCGYEVLSAIYLMKRQHDRAIAEAKRAIALDPNGADAYYRFGRALRYAGRLEEAIAELEKAIRINPIAPASYFLNLGGAYRDMGRYEEAIGEFKKVISRTPDNGFAHFGLAATYSLAGRDEEARAEVAELLRIQPKINLQALAKRNLYKNKADGDRIMAALRKAGLPEHPPLPLPDKPSIAVLPFVNLSDDPKQEYFVDGMTDSLITDLSKLSGLLVIARNSTFTYKGKHVKVQKISQDLGARYVVEGTVQKAGNDVRVNAQLIDAMTGHHLWAQRYDGKLQNIFALQDEITRKIVSSLAVKLGAHEQKDKRPETENIEAYDALLKGYEYYFSGTVDDMVMAVSYFEKAIELDPNYGRAYAALAKTYFLGPKIRREWYAKTGLKRWQSMVRARHYLEIANKIPTSTSHQIASLMALQRRQYKKALAEAELALSLEPNGAESNFDMGYALVFLGRAEEGIDYLKKSIELDPLHPGWALFYMGVSQFSMGQFDEAVELINRALAYNPKTHKMLGILAAAYAHLGREKEAQDSLQNYLRGFYYRPNLNTIMSEWPFKDPKVADRLAEGLIKAGLPGQASDYCKVVKENKLTGEEIRKLLLGRTRTGWGSAATKTSPWSMSCTKDGRIEYMDSSTYDTGKSWIEDDTVFVQYDTRFEGRKFSAEIYRNLDGTPKKMNEYFAISDFGIIPFSVKE